MIVSESDLGLVRARHANDTVVLAGGTFDILHPGHIQHLEFARSLGGILVVMLASDADARARKGPGKPINTADHRALVVDALRVVDYTIVRSGADHVGAVATVLNVLNPDKFVISETVPDDLAQGIRSHLGDTEMVFDRRPEVWSTSEIVARIRQEY